MLIDCSFIWPMLISIGRSADVLQSTATRGGGGSVGVVVGGNVGVLVGARDGCSVGEVGTSDGASVGENEGVPVIAVHV